MDQTEKKGDDVAAPANCSMLPHELLLEWAQTGLMEVAVRKEHGCFVKEFTVLSPAMRINMAKACANYFAPKLADQVYDISEQEASEKDAAEARRAADEVKKLLMTPLPDALADTEEAPKPVDVKADCKSRDKQMK